MKFTHMRLALLTFAGACLAACSGQSNSTIPYNPPASADQHQVYTLSEALSGPPPGQQYLFVSSESDGGVYIYQIGNPKLWRHIGQNQGVTNAVNFLVDPHANLFVAQPTSIKEYAWPYTGMAIATITPPGPNGIRSLAMDSSNTLFFVNYTATLVGDVFAYKPPYTHPAAMFATNVSPGAVAVAPNGDAFVSAFNAGAGGGTIVEYAPPYTSGREVVGYPAGFAALALDHSGNLWVGGNFSIDGYAPPYNGVPFIRLKNDMGAPLHRYIIGPVQLLFDKNDQLFWTDKYAGIRALTPPYTGPAQTINDAGQRVPGLYAAYYASNDIYYTYQTIAIDANGAFFVASNPLLEWTGNHGGTPTQITNGLPTGMIAGSLVVGP